MNETDSHALARWIKTRDPEAFRTIVLRHGGMVHATCRRILGNTAEAEDVAQECFEGLARNGKKAPTGYLGPWLHRVATNRALQRVRTLSRRHEREKRYMTSITEGPEPDLDDTYRFVDEAIAGLPDKLRIPVVSYYLEGRSHSDIAGEMGVSRQTVTDRVRIGVERIRKALERKGITIAATALTGLLKSHAAEAAPAALVEAMGKLALSGGFAKSSSIALSWAMIAKIGAAALVVVVGGIVAIRPWNDAPTRIDQSESGPLSSEPAAVPSPDTPQAVTTDETQLPVGFGQLGTQPESGETVAESEPETTGKQVIETVVTGWVVDQNQSPISDAEVVLIATGIARGDPLAYDRLQQEMLDRDNRYLTKTKRGDGGFEIRGSFREGTVWILASADGYLRTSKVIEIQLGVSPQPLTLELSAGLPASGRVLSTRGLPVPDAYVEVKTRMSGNSGGPGFTDDRGYFELAATSSELVALQVVSRSLGEATFSDILLEPGAFIELRLSATASLWGHISWGDGKPARGAVVRLRGSFVQLQYDENGQPTGGHSSSGGSTYKGLVDESGYYRIEDIDAGQQLKVSVADIGGPELSRAFKLDEIAPGEETRWDQVLEKPVTLRVSVHGDISNKPLMGVSLMCYKVEQSGEVVSAGTGTGVTDENGLHEFQLALGLGTYRIFYAYNSKGSVSFGPKSTNYEDVPVEREDSEASIAIPESCIHGFVVIGPAGLPLSETSVDVITAREDGTVTRTFGEALTDSDGRATVRVEPYTVVQCVFSHGNYASASSSKFTCESGGVFDDETIVLYHSAGVTGSLIDETGTPIANTPILLTVYGEGETEEVHDLATDANGFFEISENIPATLISVRISVSSGDTGDSLPLMYTSQTVEPVPSEILELGTLILRFK